MKKTFIALMATLGVLTAQADDFEYLTFQTTDGTKVSMASTSLVITFENGNMIVSNGIENQTFALSDLSKMYFSDETESSGIDETTLSEDNEAVEVFTLTGISQGSFDNLKQAQTTLQHGIYVVKSQRQTFKIAVK